MATLPDKGTHRVSLRLGYRDGTRQAFAPPRNMTNTKIDELLRIGVRDDIGAFLYGIGYRLGRLLGRELLSRDESGRALAPQSATSSVEEPTHAQSSDYKTGWVLGFYDGALDEGCEACREELPRLLDRLPPERATQCRLGYQAGLRARMSGASAKMRDGVLQVEGAQPGSGLAA